MISSVLYQNDLLVEPKPFALEGHPDLILHHARSFALLRFSKPMLCLSSALLNGGLMSVHQWLNLYVNKDIITTEPPAVTLQQQADALNLKGQTLGMMTSAKMKSLRVSTCSTGPYRFTALVTSGLSNARRAGDRADIASSPVPYGQGTINLLVVTNAALSSACQVEALMMATEAKAACLQNLSIQSPASREIATGTGTDSMGVVCDPNGPVLDFVGKHVSAGEALARAVIDALTDTVRWEVRYGGWSHN